MTTLELLQASPALFATLAGIFGLAVGSFLNVVIHRLPKMLEREWQAQCAEMSGKPHLPRDRYNLFVPRSACPKCGHQLGPLENIPILSYLMLGGKCKQCRTPISIRYPIVEGLSGLLSAVAAWHFGFGVAGVGVLVLIWALLALTFIDLDTQLLPDALTVPLLWAGLLLNISGALTDLESAVIGAAAGYLILWSIYWAFKLLTGKEGMGYGDFKLLGALGAWLGWKMLPLIILLSSVVGAAVGIMLMLLARHGRNVPIPFGPYLAGGGLIALLWGQPILQNYLQLFSMQ